jgi:nitrate/nitrite-specific signal transduction histidine kinase
VFFSSLTNAIIFIIIMWLIVQFGELQKASQKMAEGDLAYKADTSKMFFEFRKHGENLNKISEGM